MEAHEQAHLKPFDEVKAQLTTDLQKQAAANQMQNLSDKTVAGLRQDPSHPEKTADAVGGTLIQVPDVEASEPIPGIGVSKELSSTLFPRSAEGREVTLGLGRSAGRQSADCGGHQTWCPPIRARSTK